MKVKSKVKVCFFLKSYLCKCSFGKLFFIAIYIRLLCFFFLEYGFLQSKILSVTQKHLKKQRPNEQEIKKRINQLKCLEEMCHFKCTRLKSLRHHLELKHHILQEVEELQFENIEGTYV